MTKRYALVVQLPEIIKEGAMTLTKEIMQKFNVPNIWFYPPHIPIKYGFNFDDEEKLKRIVGVFNKTLSAFHVEIAGLRSGSKLFHLAVTPNSMLKEVQRQLHATLREKLPLEDFRLEESSDNYEFHFSLAESTVDERKVEEIRRFIETKNMHFSFTARSIGIMVKEGDAFVDLSLEATPSSVYQRLTNPQRPFIIAEIGSNHNGDLAKAKQLIDVAVEAGCDAVKFQSWDYNSLFSQSVFDAHKDFTAKGIDVVSLEAVQKKLALSKEDHVELKNYADKKEILFFSYPLSTKHVDWLVELDVPFIKVGSPDLPNLPLLKYIAQQGKPIILSVGMGMLAEIERALETIYSQGNKQVILLHCVAVYPPKNEENNLRNIPMLKAAFDVPVGFSDHSTSTAIPAAAIALGATVIEKHIKLDDHHCRDEAVSLTPAELKRLVKDVRDVAASLGASKKILSEDEKKRRVSTFGRRSILTNKVMTAGEIVTESNVVFKRPGTGISVDKLEFVIGRKLKAAKGPEEVIMWDDLE
ncbi:N-acetylneuraminate synthase family protein [Candidatus Woesearchaeota archaeon]|nr:N-acetylneuraminate synthase family protein [Candidatus Woesearchaeota archaeon]